ARSAFRLCLVVRHHHASRVRNFRLGPSRAPGAVAAPAARTRAGFFAETFSRRRIHPDDFRRGLLAHPTPRAPAPRRLPFRARLDRISFTPRSPQSPSRPSILYRRSGRRHAPPSVRIFARRLDLRLPVGILELLGNRKMAVQLPDVSTLENI